MALTVRPLCKVSGGDDCSCLQVHVQVINNCPPLGTRYVQSCSLPPSVLPPALPAYITTHSCSLQKLKQLPSIPSRSLEPKLPISPPGGGTPI